MNKRRHSLALFLMAMIVSPVIGCGGGGSSITAAPAALTISTTSLPTATFGTAFNSGSLAATSGTPPYTWTLTSGTLPTGLSMSTAGVISGTASATGFATNAAAIVNITVRVTDSATPTAATASKPLSLTVIFDGTTFYTNNCASCHAATPAAFLPRELTLAHALTQFTTFSGAMGPIGASMLTAPQAPQITAVLNLLL